MELDTAAACYGVRVPPSRFLSAARIRRINQGRYERQEITGACALITARDRVLELGAGLGVVGAVVAHSCAPAQMLSVEANPDLIPPIRQLYALNGLQDRITLRNAVVIAAPEAPPQVPFHIGASFLGASLLPGARRSRKRVMVDTIRYDTLRREVAPTALIMDIEGAELAFLEHADLTGLRAVIVEFHPEVYGNDGLRRCKRILRQAGFRRDAQTSTRTVWACARDQPDKSSVPG